MRRHQVRVLFGLLLCVCVACSNSGSSPEASVVTFRLVGPQVATPVRGVVFCFADMLVKVDADEENFPASTRGLTLVQSPIDPLGTLLGSILLPNGTYERVDLRLVSDCQGVRPRPVIEFSNDNDVAPFRLQDETLRLKFIGVVDVRGSTTVTLDATEHFTELATITDRVQIKPALEAVVGEF